VPLMTLTSVARIKVVVSRFEGAILDATLTNFTVPGAGGSAPTVINIIKADLVPPPPVANGSVPIEEVVVDPPVLLRSGVFGFKFTAVAPGEASGNVTLTVTRSVSSFGVVIVEFATSDGTALAAEGHYRAVHGFLQFQPFEREKVGVNCCCACVSM
jgi:hypothetical protein